MDKRTGKEMKILVIFIFCAFMLCGCATGISRLIQISENGDSIIYPATRMDVFAIGYGFSKEGRNHIPLYETVVATPFILIDLPFSLVFDTILLPVDLLRY